MALLERDNTGLCDDEVAACRRSGVSFSSEICLPRAKFTLGPMSVSFCIREKNHFYRDVLRLLFATPLTQTRKCSVIHNTGYSPSSRDTAAESLYLDASRVLRR
jgi:hypothetical protein